MLENVRIERASIEDGDEIYAMYHSLIDMPFSTWDEEYPSREIVENDLTHDQVFVMRDETRRILAAILLWEGDDFADLAPWYPDVKRFADLARLGVAREAQGQGVARRMLTYAMEQAKTQGYEAVRFLVSAENPIAQRAYAKLDFDICGEAEHFGLRWLCYQKRL